MLNYADARFVNQNQTDNANTTYLIMGNAIAHRFWLR